MLTAGLIKPSLRAAPLFALTTEQTLSALLVTAFAVCGGLMVMQDDSWWHLRCGQLIWESGSVPLRDTFSFSQAPGAHWPNHEWLAQVLMYGAYQLGGLPGLNLLGAAVACLTAIALTRAMSGSMERRLILSMLVLPWYVAALSARPQIFTMLGISTALMLLASGRLWLLPPLFLVWANLHGAVALGGLLLLVACGCSIAFDRARLPRLLLVTAACGVATLCTPLGAELLLFPLHSVGRLKQLNLVEWMAPGFRQWDHLYYWALLLAFTGLVIWRLPRLSRWNARQFAMSAAIFSLLASLSARNIPPFLLIAAVSASWLLPATPRLLGHLDYSRKNAATLAISIGVAAVLLFAAFRTPLGRLDWRPLSEGAMAALRVCPQPLFNTYNTGGYLLWFTPERSVFVDSRQDPYPIDFLRDVCAVQRSGDYRELFELHGIRSAFIEAHWPLANALRADGWRVNYQDARWLVVSRPEHTPTMALRSDPAQVIYAGGRSSGGGRDSAPYLSGKSFH